jgi:signal transduction histidine kinase
MSTSKGEILVVDDEPGTLALLTSILTEEGYRVRPADSGPLALASVAASPPDLILLDMRMPVMDGLEVCRQLKRRKESSEIPVVFVSGSTDAQARVDGLELGAVDFVIKPFDRAELLARIRTHLELSRLRSQLESQVTMRTTELERNQRALEEYKQRLQELTAGLLNAQENASRALARDLHDVFSQELSVLATQIFSLQEESKSNNELAGRLSELGQRSVRLAHNLHRTSRELHPTILEDLGLKAALADECDTFQERSRIRTQFTAENIPAELPKGVSVCLYRVAQESLRNIGKHAANCNAVRVMVSGSQGVTLRIEDNGEGFNLEDAHKKGGLGLISIEERVRLVNGSLSIHSEPGKGSTLEVVVPIGVPTSSEPQIVPWRE